MKHYEKRRSVSSKMFVMMLALVLVFGCAVGGTIAWLTDRSATVTNTFTYGDINISLAESTGDDYTIIPGVNIHKNPKVTVTKDSEACWLFVKVVETGTFVENKVTYEIDSGWAPLTGVNGVYYREVDATTAKNGVVYNVLKGDTTYDDGVITVSDSLTKVDIKGITAKPKLTFTAYAVQKDGIDSATDAWEKVKPTTSTT